MENQNMITDGANSSAIEKIIASATDLTDILNQETECLKAADTKGFKALHDQKHEIAQRYETQFHQLVSNKENLKGTNPAMLERLQDARRDMVKASKDNLTALERTNKSLNRLNERMMNLAREKSQQNTQTYGNTGALYNNDKKPISVGLIENV